ncbi:uncharacterized protein C1orf198 homolog [Denticeps clupeoides]|uniref:DUF4706 domain-containing protein n=1 Tax=Denticeps clupeoides TaxID=299321 RepID=A0AAY4CFD6_9TELE|nr:uncharacterized protein C1orf198 homolog [Denticeps clupeoides]
MAAAAVADTHRMEELKFQYFSSINSMARKIMEEREKIKEQHGSDWDKMTPNEQDAAIDNGMMDPQVRARYALHRVDREEVACYPKLLLHTGQKTVHFGDEDLTWQDEHSAPFSWETRSQMEFSLVSAAPDQAVSAPLSESKPNKVPQGAQLNKSAPSAKVSASDNSGRREEESSFWKISAERSRLEGEKADFQSLTPSQIKSLEKGEKPLPSYRRQEAEEPPRPTKQRAHKPPAPPPPIPISVTPAAISATPAPISVSSSVAGWERAQSTLPSVSPLEDVFSPGLASRTERSAPSPTSSPTFSQFNTSSNILKTGFDFLDNW